MFMLYNLEPHVELTGDIWYNGPDVDDEFVNAICSQCYGFISQKVNFDYYKAHCYRDMRL